MGPRFLIDTNAVIDLISDFLPAKGADWLDQVIADNAHALSVITRLELFSKPVSTDETATINSLIAGSLVLGLDEAVIQETIRIRQQHRRKLPDAIIAATALVHQLVLVTRNGADFRTIAGLAVVDPHDLTQLPARP